MSIRKKHFVLSVSVRRRKAEPAAESKPDDAFQAAGAGAVGASERRPLSQRDEEDEEYIRNFKLEFPKPFDSSA